MTNDGLKPTTAGKAGNRRLSRKLMVAASVSTVAAMLGVYGGRAQAQALPTGCISDGAASDQARAGDTVVCLEENDQPINGLTINVDDVTVNVGDAANPVDILTDGDGLVFLSSGDIGQRFTVFNSASTIYGANGVILNNTGAGGVTGLVEGSIDGGGVGVLIEQGGLGVVDLTVADVDNGVSINVLEGGGDVNFVSTGTITEIDADENALNLSVDAAATSNVALTLNNVVATTDGGSDGINADHDGVGDLTIVTNGAFTAYDNGFDIDRYGAGEYGAGADGDITITTNGDVTILDDDAFNIDHDGDGDITIVTNALVSVGDEGFEVDHDGTGDINITANGDLYSRGGEIFEVEHDGTGDILIVTNGAVDSAYGAFDVNHDGTGDIVITTNGDINVTGGDEGVDVDHDGEGNISVTVNGAITVADDDAVYLDHDGVGDVVALVTGDVVSLGNDAVELSSSGTANFDITVNGSLSAGDNGVEVASGSYHVGDFVVAVDGAITGDADADGSGDGVNAFLEGASSLTITTNGSVSGVNGILSNMGALGTGQSITALGDVTGVSAGISVTSSNANTTVTTSGSVTGGDAEGIVASQAGEGDLTIVATGDVTGGANGVVQGVDAITAINNGTGATVVDVSGTVNGVTSWGIDVTTVAGAEVIVRNGAVVTGPAGSVIDRGVDTTTILTLEEGGVLDGRVFFLSGDDVFNEQGGSFTTAFGGDGVDTVNFTGAARTLMNSGSAGDSLEGFEIFNFNEGGITLAGAHVGLTEANFNAGVTVLDGSLEALTATVADGAELNARDGAVLTGDLVNNGVLNIDISPGAFTVDGNVAFGSTSVFVVEVDATGHDQLITTGDVALGGTLDLRFAGGLQLGENTRRIIDAGGAISGAFDAGVPAENGLLLSNTLATDAANGDVNLVTTVRLASDIDGLNANQARVGDALIGQILLDDLDTEFGELVEAVGGLETVADLGAALTDLTPEGFDIGLRTMTVAQDRFADLLSVRANRDSFVDHDGLYAWTALQPFSLNQSADGDATGFSGGAFTFAAGVGGYALGPVTIGGALGLTTFSGDQDGVRGDEAEGSLFQMAASAMSAMTVAGRAATWEADLAFATGSTDLTMLLVDPATLADVTQAGSADISSFDIRTRLTVDGYENGALMVRPFAAAGLSVYGQDAATVGAGATALEVEAVDATRAEIAFGAEATYRMSETLDLGGALSLVQYMGDTEHEFASRFGAATTGGEFVTQGGSVSTQFQIDAGLHYRPRPDIAVSAGVLAEFGDLSAVGGSFRLSKSF